VSRIESRIQNFNALARKPGPQRILVYNGSGGYGDQIMTWPFARILTTYGFEVHVLTDPGNQTCWWNFPWIKSIQTLPMQHEQFKMYDYYFLLEAVVNTDEHQDQQHPLDVMLWKAGINPETIDSKQKVVRPNFTFLEMQSTNTFQGKQIGMYQLSAANQVRCLPPNDSAFILSKLADAYPNIHWLALYDEFIPEPYRKALICTKCNGTGRLEKVPEVTASGTTITESGTAVAPSAPVHEICLKCKGSGTLRPNIQLYVSPSLRELWALTTKATLVISPDSMMVHVAGTMDIPCVGLWGLCDPAKRTKYYKNHIPIWKREACPFSPCFAYSGVFPKYCQPRPNRTVCECLGAISPQDVIDACKQFVPLPTPAPAT
jgi:hypothetical protein